MRIARWLIGVAAVLPIAACNAPSDEARALSPTAAAGGSSAEAHSGVVGHGADDEFYAVPTEADGVAQSPINILTTKAVHGHHATTVHYEHAEALCVKNTGHTVEVDFPAGSTLEYDDTVYALAQLHFHTPSEHQLDGVTYPMEMHVVHVREPEDPNAPPEYLVVGMFFRMGEENTFIRTILSATPEQGGTETDLRDAHVSIDALLPSDALPSHFHYRGSLTTPPHTETVEWLVLEAPNEASPEQIARINALEGNNARHIHALHARAVEAEP